MEILVTIFIASVAIFSLLAFIAQGMNVVRTSDLNTSATVIAQGLLEEMLSYDDFGTVENVYTDTVSVRSSYNFNGDTRFKYNRDVEVSPLPLGSNLKKYVVNVYWTGTGGTECSVTLTTLRANNS